MDEKRPNPPGKRELTYRVGWKKGKLETGDRAAVSAASAAAAEKKRRHRLLENVFFGRAPAIPVSGLAVLLYALPVVLFGLTWWLTYLLSSVR